MATLAEMLRQGADRLVELPNDARRFMTNPQAFTQLLTGNNPMPRETGFAAGTMGLPPTEMSVLDPNQASYMQGYDQGEPLSIAAMALPFAAPAAVAGAKALAPKAGQMAENYMVRQGMIQPMMIGPSATLWNPQSAFEAAKMLKAGELPEAVFKKTNTYKGLDEQFRQELPDYTAHIKGGPTFEKAVLNRMTALSLDTPTVKDVLYHPKLLESYPDLGNIEIQFVKKGSKHNAEFSPTENIIRIRGDMKSDDAVSSMLHELQHAIQVKEGFAVGADANAIIKRKAKESQDLMDKIGELNNKMRGKTGAEYEELMAQRNTLSKQYTDPYKSAVDEYTQNAGEAEARLVQRRKSLYPEAKARQFYPLRNNQELYGLDIDPKLAKVVTEDAFAPVTRKQMLENQMKKLAK